MIDGTAKSLLSRYRSDQLKRRRRARGHRGKKGRTTAKSTSGHLTRREKKRQINNEAKRIGKTMMTHRVVFDLGSPMWDYMTRFGILDHRAKLII
jgi:hypothetical protein